MRWLITDCGGCLGTALIARLTADDTGLTGAEDDVILPLDRGLLDVTDSAAVREAVSDFRPDVVVNTAAYWAGEPGAALTADDAAHFDEAVLDKAVLDGVGLDGVGLDGARLDWFGIEDGSDDEQRAYSVNAVGPAVLALAVAATGGRLVHVSSDVAFDGDATGPGPVDAMTAPRLAYGRTKRAGELAVRELLPQHGYVVRTSWLYGGVGDQIAVRTMRLAASTTALDEPDEGGGRHGSPTWVADLAEGLIALSRSDAPAGIYHCTNSGQTTRLGFVRAVREELGVEPVREELGADSDRVDPSTRAVHSVRSGQDWAAAGLPPMPDWRDALHRAFVVDGESLRTS